MNMHFWEKYTQMARFQEICLTNALNVELFWIKCDACPSVSNVRIGVIQFTVSLFQIETINWEIIRSLYLPAIQYF